MKKLKTASNINRDYKRKRIDTMATYDDRVVLEGAYILHFGIDKCISEYNKCSYCPYPDCIW